MIHYFYLTKDYKVENSIYQRPGKVIFTIELSDVLTDKNTKHIARAIEIMQNTVEAVLGQLNDDMLNAADDTNKFGAN